MEEQIETQTEFNLSEKINPQSSSITTDYGTYLGKPENIYVEDVKEFIRLLKDDLNLTIDLSKNEVEKFVCKEYINIIDKLAGEKLT